MKMSKKKWVILLVAAFVVPYLILIFFYYVAQSQNKFENIDGSGFYRSPEGKFTLRSRIAVGIC